MSNMEFNGYEDEERVLERKRIFGDGDEKSLRPVTFDDYCGQKKVKENLKIFRSRSALRPPGAREDYTCRYYCS